MQDMMEKLMYFWMMDINVSLVVSELTVASSHGKRLSELKIAFSVVVLSSIHNGFLLLHIVRKCKWLYILIVVTKHTEKHKTERQMKIEETYSSNRK
jgi:hypothetical protein